MKNLVVIGAVVFLTGCATASPFFDFTVARQINGMSDWVLQPEREWTSTQQIQFHSSLGVAWDNGSECYLRNVIGPWNQTFVGCAKSFYTPKGRFFVKPELLHQVDSQTSTFLRTNQKQWQGHNPFIHLRAGVKYKALKCQVATGKSVFQGAPFEGEDGEPDLYWTNIECGVRLIGRGGVYSD